MNDYSHTVAVAVEFRHVVNVVVVAANDVKENGSSSLPSDTFPVAHALSTPPSGRPKVTIFRGSVADIADVGDVLPSTTPLLSPDCSNATSIHRWFPVSIANDDIHPRALPNTYG